MKSIWIVLMMASPVWAQDFGSGARNFSLHCAGCHGEDARGAGIAGILTTVDPPDLTKLTERNGGVFPVADVVFQIDGRAQASHAYVDEMPNFGALLEGKARALRTPAGQPILTSEAIAELVEWLEAIQD